MNTYPFPPRLRVAGPANVVAIASSTWTYHKDPFEGSGGTLLGSGVADSLTTVLDPQIVASEAEPGYRIHRTQGQGPNPVDVVLYEEAGPPADPSLSVSGPPDAPAAPTAPTAPAAPAAVSPAAPGASSTNVALLLGLAVTSALSAGLAAHAANKLHKSALKWGVAGAFAPGLALLIGEGAYDLARSTGPDVGITAESTDDGAQQQMTVTLPDKTKARLAKKGLPATAINANVRDAPWGAITNGLPEGTVVSVYASMQAREPGGLGIKTWYNIGATPNGAAVTGWMHQDVLR